MIEAHDSLSRHSEGRLASALAGKLRVYSFGTSGAPLSQYLIWARHADRRTYDAQSLLINVVGNDFDESHSRYKSGTRLLALSVPDRPEELHVRPNTVERASTRAPLLS